MDQKQTVDLKTEPVPVVNRDAPVVEETVEQQQPEVAPETQTEQVEPTPTVSAVNLDVDEFGVPWKNRAMEWRRKSEEAYERLPQLIDEKLSKVTQPQQQAPTYTYEQLEAYKLQNATDPNIVAWATGEQRKLSQSEQRRILEEVVGQREQKQQAEYSRVKSLEYVQQSYPETFIKDSQGRIVNWNMEHPMYKEIDNLMRSNPQLVNDPQGLSAAADIAYGRYMRSQASNIAQSNVQLKSEVKKLQKGNLVEGSGKRAVQSTTVQQAAIENLKKTGNIKDAESAIGAILRAKGMLNE